MSTNRKQRDKMALKREDKEKERERERDKI